jgi:hypothetical protein
MKRLWIVGTIQVFSRPQIALVCTPTQTTSNRQAQNAVSTLRGTLKTL